MSETREVCGKPCELDGISDALLGLEQDRGVPGRLAVPARKGPQFLLLPGRREALVDIGAGHEKVPVQDVEARYLQPPLIFPKPIVPAAMQQVGQSDHEFHVRILSREAIAAIERVERFVVSAQRMERQAAIDMSGPSAGID
jgi:hypothetical protein